MEIDLTTQLVVKYQKEFGLIKKSSSSHEWILIVGIISFHDRVMMEENEKEAILEETYEAKI